MNQTTTTGHNACFCINKMNPVKRVIGLWMRHHICHGIKDSVYDSQSRNDS